jgi:hypothetical protein
MMFLSLYRKQRRWHCTGPTASSNTLPTTAVDTRSLFSTFHAKPNLLTLSPSRVVKNGLLMSEKYNTVSDCALLQAARPCSLYTQWII